MAAVLIFAGSLVEARRYAKREGLEAPGESWKMARHPEEDRYHVGPIAVLPGFEQNPAHELLAPLAEVLEHENGPHVPTVEGVTP